MKRNRDLADGTFCCVLSSFLITEFLWRMRLKNGESAERMFVVRRRSKRHFYATSLVAGSSFLEPNPLHPVIVKIRIPINR
jgi:hypothetical protein